MLPERTVSMWCLQMLSCAKTTKMSKIWLSILKEFCVIVMRPGKAVFKILNLSSFLHFRNPYFSLSKISLLLQFVGESDTTVTCSIMACMLYSLRKKRIRIDLLCFCHQSAKGPAQVILTLLSLRFLMLNCFCA